MKVSASQVGQCAAFLFGAAAGAMLVKPGYFWVGVIVGVVGVGMIWVDVPWLPWPDDRKGPRFPDGS
jgi:hypothetical protein